MQRLPELTLVEVTDDGRITASHYDVIRVQVVEEHDGAKFIMVYDPMGVSKYRMTDTNRRCLNAWDALVTALLRP